MKLLKMTSNQCLIYSAAMVLGEDPQDLCTEIGYTGLEKFWDLPVPRCYRGHHIQEIQDLFLARGKCLYEIEVYPRMGHPGVTPIRAMSDSDAESRFVRLINQRPGILIGRNHAVAWSGKLVFDPNGRVYPLESFTVLGAYLMGQS